jgi:hypothetical protein
MFEMNAGVSTDLEYPAAALPATAASYRNWCQWSSYHTILLLTEQKRLFLLLNVCNSSGYCIRVNATLGQELASHMQ